MVPDRGDAPLRVIDTNRDVAAAGEQHPEDRYHPQGRIAQRDHDLLPRLHVPGTQPRGDAQSPVEEPSPRPFAAVGPDHRDGVGLGRGQLDEGGVQGARGPHPRPQVTRTSGTFGLRDPGNRGLVPVTGGREVEQAPLMGDRRGDESGWEQTLNVVPVDPHPAVAVVADLVVEPDLTGRGHPTRAFTEQAAVPAETLLDAEGRGEDHRETGFATGVPGQPRDRRHAQPDMFEILREVLRGPPDAGCPRLGLGDAIPGNQQRGEIPHHLFDVGVDGRAVEDRDGHRNAVLPTEDPQGLAETRQHQRGGSHLMVPAGPGYGRPGGCVDLDELAFEDRHPDLLGFTGQRQSGGSGQFLRPAGPVPPGGAQLGGPACGIAQVSGDVVAEVDLRWMWQLLTGVDRVDLALEVEHRRGVEDQRIGGDADTSRPVEIEHPDVERRPAAGLESTGGQFGPHPLSGLTAGTDHPVRRHLRQHPLALVLDDGAQHRVPRDDGVDGLTEPVLINRFDSVLAVEDAVHTSQDQPGVPAHQVGPLHLGQVEGLQRVFVVVGQHGTGDHGFGGWRATGCEISEPRVGENRRQARLPACSTHPRDHARRDQRIPTEQEEVIVPAAHRDPELFLPEVRDLPGDGIEVTSSGPGGLVVGLVRRQQETQQSLAVHLAVSGQRKFVQEAQEGAGPRNPVRLPGDQFADARIGAGHGDDRAVHGPVHAFRCDHDGLGHLWVGCDGVFDVGQFDPVPVDLHLGVQPAQELDLTVRQPASTVTGQIDPAPPRVGDELPRGQLGIVLVSSRQGITGDDDVARHQVGAGVQMGVYDVHVLARQGDAVRNGGTVLVAGGQHMAVRPDPGLGGAAARDDGHSRVVLPQPHPEVDGNPVTGDQDETQAGEFARSAGVEKHRRLCRRRVPQVHPVPGDQLDPHARVGVCGGWRDDQGSAATHHPEQVENRQIETQRGNHQATVSGPCPPPRRDIIDGGHGASMGHHDALRFPGGPGGEDDVGVAIGIVCNALGLPVLLYGNVGEIHQTFRTTPAAITGRTIPADHPAGTTDVHDHATAGLGVVDVDRDVTTTCRKHPDAGDDLLDPTVAAHHDAFSWFDALRAEPAGQPRGRGGDLAERVFTGGIDHRDTIRVGGSRREKTGVQATQLGTTFLRGKRTPFPGGGQPGLPARGAHLQLGLWDPDGTGTRSAFRNSTQGLDEGREHRIDHGVVNDTLADIPVDTEPSAENRDLAVDEDRRPLGDNPRGWAEDLDEVRGEQLADPQGGGEHDRSGATLRCATVQVAKHLDAGVAGMGQRLRDPFGVVPHLL